MKYGLSESELKLLNQLVVLPLKRQKAQIYLFGSRAAGKYKKFSDIDLFYICAVDHKISGDVIYKIVSDIEESDFPYKLDLVNYDELAMSYRKNIDLEKILL